MMPSTSGRAATYPRKADKLKFFNELKELRDRLKNGGHSPVPLTSPYFETTPSSDSGSLPNSIAVHPQEADTTTE